MDCIHVDMAGRGTAFMTSARTGRPSAAATAEDSVEETGRGVIGTWDIRHVEARQRSMRRKGVYIEARCRRVGRIIAYDCVGGADRVVTRPSRGRRGSRSSSRFERRREAVDISSSIHIHIHGHMANIHPRTAARGSVRAPLIPTCIVAPAMLQS